MTPTLLAVAHGSRDRRGAAAVEALLDRVRALRPGLPVRLAYVELAAPLLPDVLAELDGDPAVVVPLLLAAGYHTKADIRGRVPAGTPVAPALGPHPLLARALAGRLRGAGWRPGEPVVLAAAGSGDGESVAAARTTARLLTGLTGSPAVAAFAASARPGIPAAVTALRARYPGQRVAVAAYLIAPGRFADAVAAVPADVRGEPLGAHDAVAALVLRRYDEAWRYACAPRPDVRPWSASDLSVLAAAAHS
ncbi:MAG TPA: sirohydrochlorin chelatase [Mycobacteriales bacterium]|nr:sirohydrochlorin chelatase [Mycobacteriales bacterium]